MDTCMLRNGPLPGAEKYPARNAAAVVGNAIHTAPQSHGPCHSPKTSAGLVTSPVAAPYNAAMAATPGTPIPSDAARPKMLPSAMERTTVSAMRRMRWRGERGGFSVVTA